MLKLRLKSKLMILMLIASLGSILVVSFISWQKGKQIIEKLIYDQLTSVRTSKAQEIHLYFDEVHAHLQTLAEDRTIVQAMDEFNQAFKQINQDYIPSDWEPAKEVPSDWNLGIESYYNQEFFPELSQHIEGDPQFEVYRPMSEVAYYLQYHYLVKNKYPVEEKHKLNNAGDGSDYSRVHQEYHPFFEKLVHNFHYGDLYLIDFNTGDIVYSVNKKTEFATNLDRGPHRYSNLAELVNILRRNPHREAVHMVDFQFYHPSYAAPEAFLAVPIYNNESKFLGILAIQMPFEQIDNILSNHQQWEHDGLGKTGEVFLVGADYLMRSTSRFLIETPEQYKVDLQKNRVPLKTIQSIELHGTSILLQKVETPVVKNALSGAEGTKIVNDYRNHHQNLASYALIEIEGFNWAIIAEISKDEAYEPLEDLEISIFIGTAIVIVLVTGMANLGSNRFLKPLNIMVEGIHEAEKSNQDSFHLQLKTDDEWNELVQAINKIADKLDEQTHRVREQSRENEILLLNILPERVANQLKKGEKQIAEDIEQATVLVATMNGLTELSAEMPTDETARFLNDLLTLFEKAATQNMVDRFNTIGEQYVAVCGVNRLQLDHTKRILDFALDITSIIERFNQNHNTTLTLSIGIHQGALKATLLKLKENQRFTYHLWGQTMNIANYLNTQAPPNTILVSEEIYDSLADLYIFENFMEADAWILKQSKDS